MRDLSSISIPQHVAFIPDGNRRWAKQHGYMLKVGHEEGFHRLDEIVHEAAELGIKYFTAYVFSTENWNRPNLEISNLMNLFERVLGKYGDVCQKEGIKVLILGDLSRFNKKLRDLFIKIQEQTAANDKMVLSLCLNYGARDEIINACKNIARDVSECKISSDAIDNKLFAKYLYTSELPDPDLVIRTSGEVRLSNFLLWQLAYTEFVFEDKYLPDYTVDDFYNSLLKYSKRNKRYGT